MQTLGKKIKAAREAANLSQDAVAKALGVTREAVSSWESDDSRPRSSRWNRLVELLDLRAEDFIVGVTPTTGKPDHEAPLEGERTENEINAKILRDIGRQVMAGYVRGELEMSPDQFGRLVERLYLRIRKIPLPQRESEAQLILHDLTALLHRD